MGEIGRVDGEGFPLLGSPFSGVIFCMCSKFLGFFNKISLSLSLCQGGPGAEPEPETGTVGTVFPETESGAGTAGTVFQERKPEPEPSFPVKLY